MVEQILERIARGLEIRGLPYMIIGGQAVLLYGEPRLTRDVDVTLGVSPDRLSEVQDLLAALGWEILAEASAEFVKKTMVLPCLDPQSGVRVDFIFSFSPYERQAIERARSVQVGNASVHFVSPEDLIVHKVIAGRPRDLEDARAILLKNPEIDLPYVEHWLAEFDRSLDEGFLARLSALRTAG